MAKIKLVCPHCKRDYYMICENGICKPTDAFFDKQNAKLIAEKLREQGIEFGVVEEVNTNDE